MRAASFVLAAAAAMLAAPAMTGAAVVDKAVRAAPRVERRSTAQHSSSGSYGLRWGRRAAYGWTNMHARRVARKKRAVKAHRARGRGKR
jgi:hypothetical protein